MQRKQQIFLYLITACSLIFNVYLVANIKHLSYANVESSTRNRIQSLETVNMELDQFEKQRNVPIEPKYPVEEKETSKSNVFMFIAIGSAPEYASRRHEIRRTWLSWAVSGQHEYRFFTDSPKFLDKHGAKTILQEQDEFKDLVFLNMSTGRKEYGYKGMQSMQWAQDRFNFTYFMKIDDDGFPCLPLITDELMFHRPRERFVWGKYWFRKGNSIVSGIGRNRMDENFMVFTKDLINFVINNKNILVFDGRLTFAVNFAFWTHFLNLTVFDDRPRLDSQQHYVTKYMHEPFDSDTFENGTYARFCDNHIYAHHVYPGIMDTVFNSMNHGSTFVGKSLVPNITLPRKDGYLFDAMKFKGKLPKCACSSLTMFIP